MSSDDILRTAVLGSLLQGCPPGAAPVTTTTTAAPPQQMVVPALGLNNPLMLLLLMRCSGLRDIFDDRRREDHRREDHRREKFSRRWQEEGEPESRSDTVGRGQPE